jgi:translocation and assembly module TamB
VKISRLKPLLLVLAVMAVVPAWLLASESGLRFGLYCVERISGGAIRVEAVSGRLIGDVHLQGFEVITAAVQVRIEQADLNLRLTRLLLARVQAEILTVRTLAVTVRERPAPQPHTPLTVRTPLWLAVEDGHLADFRLRLASAKQDWVVPQVEFGARWRKDWIVIGRVKVNLAETGPVVARGRIAIADDLLKFEAFGITSPSEVNIEGAMALTTAAANALQLSWENLRWPRGEALSWLHSPGGVLRLEGPWRRYAWTVDARTVGADVPGQLAARGHGDLRSLALENVRVQSLGGTVRGKGMIDWSNAVSTDLDLRWENLDPVSRFAQWPGRLNGGVALHARWDGQKPKVAFDGGFDDSQLRGYEFALQTRGRTERNAVFLQQLAVKSGVSELHAAGRLWPQLALKGGLHSSDFGSLWAGLSGQGEAQFTANGDPSSPRLALRATAQALGWGKLRAGRVALDANLGLKGRSDLTLTLEQLEAGIELDRLSVAAGGTRAAHRVALAGQGVEGAATLTLQGGERNGEWRGQLVDASLAPVQDSAWTLEEPAAVVFRSGQVRLEPACLRATDGRACADLDLAPARQRIAFRIHRFGLRHLRPWLPASWTLTGALSGTAALEVRSGELAALTADLAGTAGAIEGDGVRLDYGPGRLSVQPEDGRLNAALHLTPAGGMIDGEVWITAGGALLDRPMLGDLKVKLPDLSWLPVLSAEIASAQGSIDADLNVSGTLRGPALDGRLQVAGGRVRLATPGIELTDITASFDRGRDAPLKAHLSAKSGDGQFALDGVLKTMQPKLSGAFTLKGEQVLGFNTAELRAWITPDLKLALDGRTARLTGEVAVPRAEITPRQLDAGGVGPSADQVVVVEDQAQPAAGFAVESEVRIVLGDKVRFDGLGLKTRLEGAITAYDEIGRPTAGRGELRLVGGRYKAYGQDLQIETGRLLFSGGPITDPAIDLSAYRKPLEDIKVGLRARGTLEAPQFSLYSEPAMSQEEQLSWLVLGRSLEATLKTGQQTELSGAAASLGLTGGDLLAQRLAPRLGLDEVSVAAKPGETMDLARLTIGKYLSPKLFVSYGMGLFQPGHFFRLQYDLSKRFKLVGESGLQQGGDVMYSIERGK